VYPRAAIGPLVQIRLAARKHTSNLSSSSSPTLPKFFFFPAITYLFIGNRVASQIVFPTTEIRHANLWCGCWSAVKAARFSYLLPLPPPLSLHWAFIPRYHSSLLSFSLDSCHIKLSRLLSSELGYLLTVLITILVSPLLGVVTHFPYAFPPSYSFRDSLVHPELGTFLPLCHTDALCCISLSKSCFDSSAHRTFPVKVSPPTILACNRS